MSIASRLVAGPPPRESGGGGSTRYIGGGLSSAVGQVSEEQALSVGAAFACLNFISRTTAMLPRRIVRRGDRSREQVRTDEFRHLWGRPNKATTGLSFWESMVLAEEGWGNGSMWKGRNERVRYDERAPWRGVEALYHLRPQRVDIGTLDDGTKGFRLDRSDREPYTTEQIGHIPSLSLDGVVGLSPAAVGMEALGLAIAVRRSAALFFKNGSVLSGLITSEAAVDQDSADEFMEGWNENHQGLANNHLMGVIGGNAKYERVGIPPNEAQSLETQIHTREEVVPFYGPIPHHLLGWKSNTSNFGTGIENQGLHVVTFVLLNRLRRIEEFVDEELLPPELEYKFGVNALMRADVKTRSAFYREMRQSGIFSADQILALEDMPPRDIPDDYLVNKAFAIQPVAGDGAIVDPTAKQPALSAPGATAAIAPPRADTVAAEARCPGCGWMHGKNVSDGDFKCSKPDCRMVSSWRGGRLLLGTPGAESGGETRDVLDLTEALLEELGSRLF